MYKSNQKHLQPLLISNVNDLPEEQRQRLESSWAGRWKAKYNLNNKIELRIVLKIPMQPGKSRTGS